MSPEKSEPQQSLFVPPASEVLTAEDLAKPPERRGRMIVLGLLFGILLWVHLVYLPIDWLKPIIPSLLPLIDGLPNQIGYAGVRAVLAFLSELPQTLIVVWLAIMAIRRTSEARAVLYASLVWPLTVLVVQWLQLISRVNTATRLGWDISIVANIARMNLATSALRILLVYGAFLLLVVTLLHVLNRMSPSR